MYIRRKIYSYNEPEEQLYSVVMGEDELALFSDFCDELISLYSNDDDIAKAAGIGGAAAATAGLGYAGYKEAGNIKTAGKRAYKEAKHALAKNKITGKVVKEGWGEGALQSGKELVGRLGLANTTSKKAAKKIYKDLMRTKAGKAALAAAASGTALAGGAGAYKALKKD